MKLQVLTAIKKLPEHQKSHKFIQWEPSCSTWMDGQTGRQIYQLTDVIKLTEDFPNFAKTSKKTFRPLPLCVWFYLSTSISY